MSFVKFLVDTNVWLELLLAQSRAAEAETFLSKIPVSDLAISDFSLHSIGIILSARNQDAAFASFLSSFVEPDGISVIKIDPSRLAGVVAAMRNYKLDFDDAYQYTLAAEYDLQIISFDAHFDRAPKGRKTPGQI